jgi:hypothetical protein
MAAGLDDFFASRRNYDVIAGRDRDGIQRVGVLEQSWRIGGASPAELLALRAFAAQPGLQRLRAACREVHGDATPPAHAAVCYHGDDPGLGALLKNATVEDDDGHPA